MVKFYHPGFLWFWVLILLAVAAVIYSRIQRRKSLEAFAAAATWHANWPGYRLVCVV
jgi:hypothetical protein